MNAGRLGLNSEALFGAEDSGWTLQSGKYDYMRTTNRTWRLTCHQEDVGWTICVVDPSFLVSISPEMYLLASASVAMCSEQETG